MAPKDMETKGCTNCAQNKAKGCANKKGGGKTKKTGPAMEK